LNAILLRQPQVEQKNMWFIAPDQLERALPVFGYLDAKSPRSDELALALACGKTIFSNTHPLFARHS